MWKPRVEPTANKNIPLGKPISVFEVVNFSLPRIGAKFMNYQPLLVTDTKAT
jgi:hypothetical protein